MICCSGKRVSPENLNLSERAFWKETRFFQPVSDDELLRALRRLVSDRGDLWQLLQPLLVAGELRRCAEFVRSATH